MAQITCNYCGTEYDDALRRCPLCGTVSEEAPEVEEREEEMPAEHPRRSTTRRKAGAHAAPNNDKIPKWLSIIICVVLALTVLIGAIYALYEMGVFTPKKQTPDDPSLSLPFGDGEEAEPEGEIPDEQLENQPEVQQPESQACTGISLTPTSVSTNAISLTQTITAIVTPATCNEPLYWSTSDASVCTVDSEGVITTTGYGTATVTATCGDITSEVQISCIYEEPPNNASLNLVDITMREMKEKATLLVSDAPAGASITWSSSDSSICTVESGTVTALRTGTATITADVDGKRLTCIVRCNIPGTAKPSDENAEGSGAHSLDHSDVTLRVGESFEISVVNGVSGGWSVSDASVITVDGGGIVTAIGTGTATVFTTVGGQRLECIVRVS